MTIFWEIYTPEDNLTRHYKCDPCKFFHGNKNAKNAVVELRGNDKSEHAEGQLMRVCEKHLQELKDAGEVQ